MVMMCAACGFAGVQHYNEIKDISICEFLPPHLVIYVDLPAEEVQKKLKQSAKVETHLLLIKISPQCFIRKAENKKKTTS